MATEWDYRLRQMDIAWEITRQLTKNWNQTIGHEEASIERLKSVMDRAMLAVEEAFPQQPKSPQQSA